MKKTLKIVTLFLVLILSVTALFACDKKEDPYTIEYEYNDDGTATVKGLDLKDGKETDIVIPETTTTGEGDDAKTYNVTAISADAFKGNTAITSVDVPTSVKSIASGAFNGCTALTTLNLPFIGGGAYKAEGATTTPADSSVLGFIFGTTAEGGVKQEYTSGSTKTYAIPDSLTNVTINGGGVSYHAFNNCTKLTTITLNNIASINSKAFEGCGVTNISISGLATINANTLKEVKDSVKTLTIGKSVTTISANAFRGLSKLETVNFTTYTEKDEEGKNLITKCDLASIGESAFEACSALKSVNIPFSVTTVGKNAFASCSAMTSVTFDTNDGSFALASIGESAFKGCTKLESITLPFVGTTKDGTTNAHFGYIFGATSYTHNVDHVPTTLANVKVLSGSIAANAFEGCATLKTVELGSGVTSIGTRAFYKCSAIEGFKVDKDNENYKADKLGHLYTSDYKTFVQYALGRKETTFKFHKNFLGLINVVEKITDYAFAGDTELTSVEIPKSVKSIGSNAFLGCSALTLDDKNFDGDEYDYQIVNGAMYSKDGKTLLHYPVGKSAVELTSTVEVIAAGAFKDCTFATIELPATIKTIGDKAFEGCVNLKTVNLKSVVTIGDNAFAGCTALETITVADDNGYYNAVDGVLYTEDNKTLVQFPAAKTAFTKPATVTAIGANAFENAALTSVDLTGIETIGANAFAKSKIESVTLSNVTLGASAFRGCTALTSVTLTDVEAISDSAFAGCTALTSVTLTGVKTIGANAFSGCTLLASVDLTGVEEIGDSAFANTGLTTVVVPDSVTSIGKFAFSGCKLTAITLPFVGATAEGTSNTHFGHIFGASSSSDNNKYAPVGLTTVTITGDVSIASNAFNGCKNITTINLQGAITSIGTSAFAGCEKLTTITIPASVKDIGASAFSGCYDLATVTFDANSVLETIGNSAFYNCDELVSVTIPASVKTIGDSAFANCNELHTVTISSTVVESIGTSAFSDCTKLAEITCTSEKYVAVDNVLYRIDNKLDDDGEEIENEFEATLVYFAVAQATTDFTVPATAGGKNVVAIAANAFKNAKNLKTVTVGNNVKSIGDSAFDHCTRLTTVTIGDSVETIGTKAFNSCNALTKVTLGKAVETIGDSAFANCEKLAEIAVDSENKNYVVKTASRTEGEDEAQKTYVYYALYTSDLKTLVKWVGTETTFEVDIATVTIAANAFEDAKTLESITMHNNIKSIGASAFEGCTDTLKTVVFKGTTSEWNSISKNATIKFIIECIDGKLNENINK